MLQVHKILGEFSEIDKQMIESLKRRADASADKLVELATALLLDQVNDAEGIFNDLTDKERDKFIGKPIMKYYAKNI